MSANFDLNHDRLARDSKFATIARSLSAQSRIDSRDAFNRYCRKACLLWSEHFSNGPVGMTALFPELLDRIKRNGDGIIQADEKALAVLLKSPAIPGLTESLTDMHPTARRTILAKLRRARLLAAEDPHKPGCLDAHPLVREYFGEQLRSQQTDAWKECNRRLFFYYRTLAPQLPTSFREIEPLFLAVICGCNAGLLREALHEVYTPRIQRGDSSFAANVLGARGALLLVLAHFFENGRWGSLAVTGVEGESLTAEDQLFILMQAGSYLTATRGMGSPEARICYERAEPLCYSLGRPLLLCVALIGQWRYSLHTDKLTATMQIAKRVHSLAQEQNDAALMIEAYRALAVTLYHYGEFETAHQYAMRAVQIWRSGNTQSHTEGPHTPVIVCLCYGAGAKWHLGEIASCRATIAEAISLAKKQNDMNAFAMALAWAAGLPANEGNTAEVDRFASDLIELCTRHNFAYWRAIGVIWRGWARSASGDTAQGIAWIEQGIRDYRATGAVLGLNYYLGRKAEALHLADRTSEALEAINEAEALAERLEHRDHCARVHWLRGVFLAAMDAEETQIEASFREAVRIAREQKSISLEKRAEGTYAEYVAKKRPRQEDVESDYLFGDCLQRPAFLSRPCLRNPSLFSPALPDSTNRTFWRKQRRRA